MKYQKELNFIKEYVKKAYKLCACHNPKKIKFKSKFDLVTEIDVAIEKYLTKKILEFFPNDKICGEETSHSITNTKRFWTIDPIDGTYNMTKDVPFYGVQCSLVENGKIVLGVIYLPCLNEMIYAAKGLGCYCNNKLCKVKDIPFEDCCVTFGDFPHSSRETVIKENKCMMAITDKIAKVRMYGSAAVDGGFIACGKTAGTVLITKNLWDVAPTIIICQEAGAIVTNLKGKQFKIGDDGIVVACSSKLSNLLKKALN